MKAIKLKSGIVMIENNRFPLVVTMAPGAGNIIAGIKLIVVNIGMTIQTPRGKI
jgi:hypothetical protein